MLAVPHTAGTRMQSGLLKCWHFYLPVPFGEELSEGLGKAGFLLQTRKWLSFLLTNCKYVNTPFLNVKVWTNTEIAMNSKDNTLDF